MVGNGCITDHLTLIQNFLIKHISILQKVISYGTATKSVFQHVIKLRRSETKTNWIVLSNIVDIGNIIDILGAIRLNFRFSWSYNNKSNFNISILYFQTISVPLELETVAIVPRSESEE